MTTNDHKPLYMKTFKTSVDITLRPGILDVQGKTVEHALHAIEFPTIHNVRMGKFVEFDVQAESADAAQAIAQAACEKLIANPIMEDFHIHITEAA